MAVIEMRGLVYSYAYGYSAAGLWFVVEDELELIFAVLLRRMRYSCVMLGDFGDV